MLSFAARLFAGLFISLLATGCRLPGRPLPVPPPKAAADLFERARSIPSVEIEDRLRALRLAEEAAELAPDWVAPRRWVDDAMRDLLRGPEAFERRRRELDESPQDPQRLYLVGRLEGPSGGRRLEQAARLGDGAWVYHGRAWTRFSSGLVRGAARNGRLALERARDPYERAFFARMLANYAEACGEQEVARSLLSAALTASDLLAKDRLDLELALVQCELSSKEPSIIEHGFQLGLELFGEPVLGDAELRELFDALWEARVRIHEAREAIEGRLCGLKTPLARRLRGRLALDRGAFALALGALGELEVANTREWRMARLACGQLKGPIEEWCKRLPAQVLAENGLPADGRLAAVVRAARAEEGPALGQALLEAGWFEELRGLSEFLVSEDPELALRLDSRAAAGLAALQGVRRLLGRIDAGGEVGAFSAVRESGQMKPAAGRGLDDLLVAMQPHICGWNAPQHALDGRAFEALSDSPRYSFGPFADVIHPGPWFSESDERAGLGVEGDEVPGLARALASMGRFGVFGRAAGQGGPDGTILRRVRVESIANEHLGVGFTGTVAWCEGIDVPARPARRGVRITGAALHEGYWIDIAGVRSQLRDWRALDEDWIERAPAFVVEALAVLGPECGDGESPVDMVNPLGEARRIRLAVLRDRARDGRAFGERVTLEELLDTTARHEEGHLMDRSRFLPIASHWLAGLGLLVDVGFSPTGLGRRLEYRAQLVALCVTEDPRMVLAECVGAVEGGGNVTPHAAAYRNLLRDFLVELSKEPVSADELDGKRFYLYQLHRLGPETVRRVARALALREGLLIRS